MSEKLIPIAVGDTKEIGKKEHALTDDGEGIVMQVAVPFSKTYTLGGMLAAKAKLEAELAEFEALIAKHAELKAVKP
jgi:hypothetical protein